MKIERYNFLKKNEILKIIKNNEFLESEKEKILMERPSEIVRFYDENKNIISSMYLWNDVPDYKSKKTLYIGNIKTFQLQKNLNKIDILFKKLFKILKGEGFQIIIGPLNGTTWNRYRYVVEKGDREPFFMEPWNEDEEVKFIEYIGFSPFKYYFSSIMENTENRKILKEKIEKIKKFPFYKKISIKNADTKNFEKLFSKIYDISVESFKNNFLYTKLEKNIFMKMYSKYKEKFLSNFFKLLYFEKRLIGFAFAFPDYLEIERGGKTETIIFKTGGVIPEFNGKGLGYILLDAIIDEVEKSKYSKLILALTFKSNVSKNMAEHVAKPFRKYALFIKEL